MAAELFNSLAGFSVGIPPVPLQMLMAILLLTFLPQET